MQRLADWPSVFTHSCWSRITRRLREKKAVCADAGGIWRGCIIWETLKGRECWVASEAAEEKGDWGKAFQLAPEEDRESRIFIFSHVSEELFQVGF